MPANYRTLCNFRGVFPSPEADIAQLSVKRQTGCRVLYILFAVTALITISACQVDASEDEKELPPDFPAEWQAGVAHANITPQTPMWMAGYAGRNRPSEGVRHDLWAKSLAIEDMDGNQAVMVSTDILGFSKDVADNILDEIESVYDLDRSQIMLNSSHTHTGPVVENALYDIYPLDNQQKELIAAYSRTLEDKIVRIVGKALESMEPARLYAENGYAGFQVNRRNNSENDLPPPGQQEGPNEYSVPVLKVESEDERLMAIVFGYACHPTVMNDYLWSGDFPGIAQMELEKSYPGVTALFFQGAGGDLNPLPRHDGSGGGRESYIRIYGQQLAASVNQVLDGTMRPLRSELQTTYSEIDGLKTSYAETDLALEPHRTTEEYSDFAAASAVEYQQRWANRMAEILQKGEHLIQSYPYPVQVWRIGDQPVVGLGGEVVIAYAISIKELLGSDAFVFGYTNDVMGYIPSEQVLDEGGYEGGGAKMVYGLPSRWKRGVEADILEKVLDLAEMTGISQ